MIIRSEHTVESKEVLLHSQTESLLKDSNHFIEVTETENDLDGNYLVLDSKRNSFICSGCAEMGIVKRWKEHTSAAKLTSVSSLNSVLYMSYPHNETNQSNISSSMCRGDFQQLTQTFGVGFLRSDITDIIKLFEGDKRSKDHVNRLNGVGIRTTFQDKWYRHIFYCFECAYALLIDEGYNMSSNPGF